LNTTELKQELTMKQLILPLTTLVMGLFMVILDSTVMNVALHDLVKDFNSDLSTIQWTVTSYVLAGATVIPLSGWLSDRFGAKRIFLISISLFTIGSLLCALALNVEQLIAFRIIQGLGGGMVMPISLAIIYRISPAKKVGTIMSTMGIPVLLAPALGPVLSGWLIEYVTWQWIFLINIPVGFIAILMGLRNLPVIPSETVAKLDVWGLLLGPLSFATLLYGISEGTNSWTTPKTLIGFLFGVISLILFSIVELKHKNPILELRVFRSSRFTRGIIVQWINQIVIFGTLFLVPLFFQQVKGYSAFETGLMMLPYALSVAIFMPIGGRLFDKIGVRLLVITGMGFVAIAAFLLSTISLSNSYWQMMVPLSFLGIAMGLSSMSINTYLVQIAPQNIVSRVTALTSAAQQVMSSLAIAGLTTFLTTQMKGEPSHSLQSLSASFSETFLIPMGFAIIGLFLAISLYPAKPKPLKDNHTQTQ
jgi:EmrB/QacA subfamily drug resistance transporter